jgi:hypothetical protein
MFVCVDCGEEKPSDQYYVTKGKSGRPPYRFKFCKACHCIRTKAAYRKWPKDKYADYCKNSQLKKNYGISLADFRQMRATQGHKCAICGTSDPGGKGEFHVDHCHDTGAVRGLLCHGCNVGIGHLSHDIGRLAAAIAYLRSHAKERAA